MDHGPFGGSRQGSLCGGGNPGTSNRAQSAHIASQAVPPQPAVVFGQLPTSSVSASPNYGIIDPYQRCEVPRAGGIPARGANRRLRVEDALSYLDQVKQQFSQAPEVYSDFLDIMKDFKSQTIDTPGVIRRVSRLFRGRPNLIVGFNTFLPPGFEVRLDGTKIVISEPSGRTQIIDEEPTPTPVPTKTEVEASTEGGTHAVASTTEAIAAQQPIGQQGANVQPEKLATSTIHPQPQFSPAEQSPIEFDQAINYVNKIKARFQNRPDVYRQFLEILHSYQQVQKGVREQDEPQTLTESQVYSSVAVLFESEPDLLREFSQFLPDARGFLNKPGGPSNAQFQEQIHESAYKQPVKPSRINERATFVVSPQPVCVPKTAGALPHSMPPAVPTTLQKRPSQRSPAHHASPQKKIKVTTPNVTSFDTDLNEAMKCATVDEYLFFDKIRKLLPDEAVHNNFLRCLMLFNQNIISKNELIELVTPFIGKRPELIKFMKNLLGFNDSSHESQQSDDTSRRTNLREDGIPAELSLQIDYATCKRLGISYRSLPDSYKRPTCTGRTPLCDSVLNDSWVSFPSWSSEDTSCVHSKKSQYEEFIYRTEDERFELDIIIEVNKAALEALEFMQRKMSRMKKEELSKFRLDQSLGSSSPSLMYRAFKRIYGEHVYKMLEAAQKNPPVVIPKLIERLRSKEREWRDAQVQFNRVWREQTEKYFVKSLDHQALSFKQNDLKLLRSKMIIHHFEMLYDERETRMEEGGPSEVGPHCILDYPSDMSVLYDVNDLVIHYVKRQPSIQKEEKRQAKRCLKRLIPEFFNIAPQEMSDEEDNDEEVEYKGDKGDLLDTDNPVRSCRRMRTITSEKHSSSAPSTSHGNEDETVEEELKPVGGSSYRLFYGANTWCVFIRLHQMLCDRLARLKRRNSEMLEEFKIEERIRIERERVLRQSRAAGRGDPYISDADRGLHLLKKSAQCPDNFYRSLICEVKNLLDGQIESSNFEDSVRNMFGTDAYITFTMDKIITTMGRQLQAMSAEELNAGTLELYHKYRFEKPANIFSKTNNEEVIEAAYETAAQQLLANQNCFKTFFLHENNKVTLELIDSDVVEEGNEKPQETEHNWSRYLRLYLKTLPDETPSEEQKHLMQSLAEKPLFLLRHIRYGVERSRKEEEIKKKGKSRGKGRPCEKEKDATVGVKNDLHIHFSSADNYQLRFASGGVDLLIRNGAPRRGVQKHKSLVARRKERFTSWLEERLCEESSEVVGPRNWLSDGSKMVPVRHPVFHYLTYNRYVTTSDDTSSACTGRS